MARGTAPKKAMACSGPTASCQTKAKTLARISASVRVGKVSALMSFLSGITGWESESVPCSAPASINPEERLRHWARLNQRQHLTPQNASGFETKFLRIPRFAPTLTPAVTLGPFAEGLNRPPDNDT